MEWRYLKVVRQIRAGRSQGRAAAQWSSLVALPDDGMERKMVFVAKLLIEPSYAVVAVSELGAGAEEIASGGGEACDARTPAPGPETARAKIGRAHV